MLSFVAACSMAFSVLPQTAHSTRRPHTAASTTLMAVSKGELVDAIAARAGVSKKMAGAVLTSGQSYSQVVLVRCSELHLASRSFGCDRGICREW
jgi:hypothetical protein